MKKNEKMILFVCIENACRSQMAEGFANHYAEEKVSAYSAGSKPKGEVNPLTIEVMQGVGIDISSHKPKAFTALPVQHFDYVVTMGCKDVCPFYSTKKSIEWDVEDPNGKGIEVFRKVRDEIEKKVLVLIGGI